MNNELKLNVDEQQEDIIHLKEYCDIDDIKGVSAKTAPPQNFEKL